VKEYLDHLDHLDMMNEKRKTERKKGIYKKTA
jgi:hypothetical protein